MLLIYLLSFLPLVSSVNNTNITATPALSARPSLITTYSSKYSSTLQVSVTSLPSLPSLQPLPQPAHSPSSSSQLAPIPSQSAMQTQTQLQTSISPSESVSFMPQMSSPNTSSKTASPKVEPEPQFYNQSSFQIAFPLGLAFLILGSFALSYYMTPAPQKLILHQVPVVNPIQLRPDHIIENGLKYYYDGPGGKLLAYGWKRESHNGEVWYASTIGEQPSWTPIYK